MLSLEKCRELLDGASDLTDSELIACRDQLSLLARTIVELANDVSASAEGESLLKPDYFRKSLSAVPADAEVVEEAAAVLEFEGGLTRDHSERLAFARYLKQREQSK